MRTCFVFLNPDFYVQYLLVTTESPAIYISLNNAPGGWLARSTTSAEQNKRYKARCDKTPHWVKDIMPRPKMALLSMVFRYTAVFGLDYWAA